MTELPYEGAASAEVREAAHNAWLEAARHAGVDLTGFDPNAPLERRIAWALNLGLVIALIYARFSTKFQRSTADQVRACMIVTVRCSC
jgi:hypothetical protein